MPPAAIATSDRMTPLEGYRGIASLIVLIHHFFLGFSPRTTGFLADARDASSLVGRADFFIFNGSGAVGFFFTLSGFVLCWSYFQHGQHEKLMSAFLKRLPRLAGPVLVATLLSYALFKAGCYEFEQSSQLSGSTWMATFAFSGLVSGGSPNLLRATAEALSTFFTGKVSYNTTLWTMNPEFLGSLVVFALGSFIATALRFRHLLLSCALLASATLLHNKFLFPFVVGVFLAAHHSRTSPHTRLPLAMAFMLVGLYALGYVIPEGAYAWVALGPGIAQDWSHSLLHTLGAVLIIHATMTNAALFSRLTGPVFKFLGKLSFPLYLVHTLVIFSLSSRAHVWLHQQGLEGSALLGLVFLVTLAGSFAMAWPLALFDDWWLRHVNAWTARWVPSVRAA